MRRGGGAKGPVRLARLAEDALADFCAGVFDRIAQDTDLDTVDAATATLGDNQTIGYRVTVNFN